MKYLFLITFLICVKHAFAQQIGEYKSPMEGFSYVEHVIGPEKADLPLLIAFHYSSGTPAETLQDYNRVGGSLRIIVPKGNHKKRNGFSYYPINYYQTDSTVQFSMAKITVDSIARFVRAIENKYNKKAIVSGISQGGDIALLLALYYPDLCIASFPFAAVINPSLLTSPEISNSVPIFLHQGEADKIVSVAYTREKVSQLEKKINLKLFTYPQLGHDISNEMKDAYSKQIEELIKKQ